MPRMDSVILVRKNYTGAAAIAATADSPATNGMERRLVRLELHFSAAPANAGSLTVTRDASAGAAYDAVLVSQSMVAVADYVWVPDDCYIAAGEELDIAYANPDNRTYGLLLVMEDV